MTYDPLTASAEMRDQPRLSARLLQAIMPEMRCGTLRLQTPSGDTVIAHGREPGPEATMVLNNWRIALRLATSGEAGFAQGYIDGDWATPDLPRMLDWGLRNEESTTTATRGTVFSRLMLRLRHLQNANTKRGSRQNISAHYDLGNAFYEQWLDDGMAYSSALYKTADETLEAAQDNKLDRITEMLDIKGGERVLEIGFGWGGVLERLIGRHKCTTTGLTLSHEQLAYSQARLDRQGMGGSADLRLQDYRDVQGTFDRIVSIEMLEAVGEKYWPVYFDKLRTCLKDTGTAVLQVITIAEERFASYRATPDFIQRHIFPGGMLPTKTILHEQARRAGFEITDELSFGHSYARTLQEWRKRFMTAWPTIEPLKFDARFRRVWDYYLAYCEVGFLNNSVDVGLYTLKPTA